MPVRRLASRIATQLKRLCLRFLWPPSVWSCNLILSAHESQQRWDSRVSTSDNPDGR